MKNRITKITALLISLALVTACQKPSTPSSSSSGNAYDNSDSQISSNSDSSDNSGADLPVDGIDEVIEEFLHGTSVTMPSLKGYESKIAYDVLYYYAYSAYFIAIEVEDEATVDYLNNKLPGESGLTSLNDDDDYTIEDYGYIWGDGTTSVNVYLSYFVDDGYSVISLYRYDGEAGVLDVSDVDTSWYVDYVNFSNLTTSDYFPKNEINTALDLNLNIPDPVADVYPNAFIPAHEDAEGTYPDAFYVVLEGDQVEAYANKLTAAGFTVNLVENTGETIDWDNYEIVEYTYYTASAYDTAHKVFISVYTDDDNNTIIVFNKFSDVKTDKKTTNTGWTDQEQLLMTECLGELLPFMAFGSDYEVFDDSDEDWSLLVLQDSYYESLADEYIAILLANGFKKDSTSYDSDCYVLDNGIAYIEIFLDYYDGNYLEIYFEDSKLEPATSIRMSVSYVYIVKGNSWQLSYSCLPEGSFARVTWSSDDESSATVDQNGLVTINPNATAMKVVTITATSSTGLTDKCQFEIREDVVDDVYGNDLTVVPGGEKVQMEYGVSPCGATPTEQFSFEAEAGKGLHVDQDGKVWADETAVPGTTGTITISYGSGANVMLYSVYVKIAAATVTHTLNQAFFGLKDGYNQYATYTKTVEGGSYEAQCAAGHGIQLRSKNNNSGIIGHMDGRHCESITFTFDTNTYQTRVIDIYGSNEEFEIADMYGSSMNDVGSVSYTQGGQATFTYTFTEDYSYIGFRSHDNALYLTSIEVVWR